MKTRIAVYGGTNLSPSDVRFVRRLTRSLLAFEDVVLVSGGFARYKRHPERTSVDVAVLMEAEQRVDAKYVGDRFETWLPAPALDRRSVERFRRGTIQELHGSAQARRFAVVSSVDALVTIGGEGQTRTVLELAMALGKPALPVGFTGGDSGRIWQRSRDDLASALRIDAAMIRRLESRPRSMRERDRLADQVARAAHEAAEKRCLVLMPFGRGHDSFYIEVLRPVIEASGFVSRRLDKDEYAGDIPTLFLTSLARSHAVLVDVTGSNPNVMYELGQVHARLPDHPAVLLRERLTIQSSAMLPFYLRHERLISASDDEAGRRRIAVEVGKYLERIARRRTKRRLYQA